MERKDHFGDVTGELEFPDAAAVQLSSHGAVNVSSVARSCHPWMSSQLSSMRFRSTIACRIER